MLHNQFEKSSLVGMVRSWWKAFPIAALVRYRRKLGVRPVIGAGDGGFELVRRDHVSNIFATALIRIRVASTIYRKEERSTKRDP